MAQMSAGNTPAAPSVAALVVAEATRAGLAETANTALVAAEAVTARAAEGAALAAAAAAVMTDAALATAVNTGTTKTQLSSTYTAPQAYVPAPTGVFATDTANILAAANKLPSAGAVPGGTIVLREGQYLASLPDRGDITYRGAGRSGTEIRCQTGVMLTVAALRDGINFEHLTLSTVAGHLIDLGTTGIANGHFYDVTLVTYIDGSSLIRGAGACHLMGYAFRDVHMSRPATATVPAVDVASSAGAINANMFDTVTCYSNNGTTGGPVIRLEGTLGAYCHDNTFRNIIGEGCRSGLVHVHSPNGLSFESVAGWDAVGDYTDHLTGAFTSLTAGGKAPRCVRVSNVGTRYGTMAAGKMHFYCATYPGNTVMIDGVGDPNGTSLFSYIANQSVRDASGVSGGWGGVVGTNYSLLYTDGIVLFSGANLTATLPSPSAAPNAGAKLTVLNSHSTALTVLGAAGPVSLAQYQGRTFVTDGAAWYSTS